MENSILKTKNKEPLILLLVKNEFTVLERCIYWLILNQIEQGFNIDKDLFQNKVFQIPLSALKEINVKRLKETAEKLMSQKVKYESNNDEKFDHIIPFPEVRYDGKKGFIEVYVYARVVLEPVKVELKNINGIPINFDYENCGNKQRNVTHLQFTVTTAFHLSQTDKQNFIDASKINPKIVQTKLEDIIVSQYNFRENHRNIILGDKEKINKFATLHIEFENGLHSKVKNKTAYILACLDMVKKKSP